MEKIEKMADQKAVADAIGKFMKKWNIEEPKALPEVPEATVIWKNWPQVKNPQTPEPTRRKVVEVDRRPKWGNVLGDTIARNAKPVNKRGENAVGLKTTKKTWNSEKTEYTTDDASNTTSVSLTEKKNKVTWTKISSSWATARGWNSGRPTTDFSDLEKVGEWEFWAIYKGVKGVDAEKLLIEKKWWEVEWAYTYKWKPVDLVRWEYDPKTGKWFWLSKISEKHPEVLGEIQDLLDALPEVSRTDNRIKLDDGNYHITVSLNWKWKEKKWILTAFEIWRNPQQSGGSPTSMLLRQFNSSGSPESIAKKSKKSNLLVPFMNKSPKWGEKYQVAMDTVSWFNKKKFLNSFQTDSNNPVHINAMKEMFKDEYEKLLKEYVWRYDFKPYKTAIWIAKKRKEQWVYLKDNHYKEIKNPTLDDYKNEAIKEREKFVLSRIKELYWRYLQDNGREEIIQANKNLLNEYPTIEKEVLAKEGIWIDEYYDIKSNKRRFKGLLGEHYKSIKNRIETLDPIAEWKIKTEITDKN